MCVFGLLTTDYCLLIEFPGEEAELAEVPSRQRREISSCKVCVADCFCGFAVDGRL